MAGVRDTTLGDSLSVTRDTGQWFSPGTPVSSNKTGRHDLSEKFVEVALSTIKPNQTHLPESQI